MNAYHTALLRYLENTDVRQGAVAFRASVSQAAINRYAHGKRFPNAAIAKQIDAATAGAVPFELWRAVAAEKFGIAA